MGPTVSTPVKRPANFAVVIESPHKRQRPDTACLDSSHYAAEMNRDSDSATTKPHDTPEPPSPDSSQFRKANPDLKGKPLGSRELVMEIPHPLSGPYKVQIVCDRIWNQQRNFPKCLACISRQAHIGGCKFAGLRAFPIDPETNEFASLTHPMFLDSAPFLGRNQREAVRNVEVAYSTSGTVADIEFIKTYIAPTLSSVLANELVHEFMFREEGLTRRRREAGVRPVCDGCATTIFSGHFMCCMCGREVCLDCYSEWDESKENENMDSCAKRRRHTKRQMLPFALFEKGELEALIRDVKSFPRRGRALRFDGKQFPRHWNEGFRSYIMTSVDDVTEDDFSTYWALGQPLVLKGCLERFQISWTPEHFMTNYGKAKCILVNCESDKMITSTVEKFFQGFDSSDAKKPLKLKDWPPADDFAKIFPDLFLDFENALPFPRYTRRKGFMNLASRFPEDFVTPDIGPKMYCAYASNDGPGSQGTTKLHLDMSDAINIMTFASPNENVIARGGAAVWDIFPADATDAIRDFLRETVDSQIDDPVMRHKCYLTNTQLEKLRDEYNIVPWRIYQNPGDAVFIPAGCAHQVCNLTSCIKVACDFVSPQAIRKCCEFIDGTRRLAGIKGGKREDVLQLKTMLMCAWEEMERWQAKTIGCEDRKEASPGHL